VTLTTGSQSQTVTYHAKVSDNVGINSYSLSGASFSSTSGGNYYWTETFSYGSYGFGSTSVSRTVSFSDAAGNSQSASLTLTVSKSDTQVPSISSFSPNSSSVALNNSTTSVSRTFTVNVSDNVAVDQVTVDGATYSSRSGNNWYFTKTFSFNDYSFGSQTITFVAVARDSAGNVATKNTSISLSKSDTQAPSISNFTVSDSSISVTSSSTTQTVTFA
jgi:translation elongation factor P/translation initiation factor 5A